MQDELRETKTFLVKRGGAVKLVEDMPDAASTGLNGERSKHRAKGNADKTGWMKRCSGRLCFGGTSQTSKNWRCRLSRLQASRSCSILQWVETDGCAAEAGRTEHHRLGCFQRQTEPS